MAERHLNEAQLDVLDENTRLVHESGLIHGYLQWRKQFTSLSKMLGDQDDSIDTPSVFTTLAQESQSPPYAELPFLFYARTSPRGVDLDVHRVGLPEGNKIRYSDARIGYVERNLHGTAWPRFFQAEHVALAVQRVMAQEPVGLNRFHPRVDPRPLLERWLAAQG